MTFLDHNPDTCAICQLLRGPSIRQAAMDIYATSAPRIFVRTSGFNPMRAAAELDSEFDATGALDFLFGDGAYKGYEDEDETNEQRDRSVSAVIAEVNAGRFLTADEGQVLVDALVEEEQEHSETLADLYDAEDRVEELEAQTTQYRGLLRDAADGLMQAAGAIVSLAGRVKRQARYISALEARVAELESRNRQLSADALGRSFISGIFL